MFAVENEHICSAGLYRVHVSESVFRVSQGPLCQNLNSLISSGVVWQSKDLKLSRSTLYLLSPRLCFFIVCFL